MATDPIDNAISNFTDFSGLARSNAIRWLKAHNNDPQTALNAWVDSGMAPLPPPQYTDVYSEDQFHSDREGNAPRSQIEASFGTQETATLDPSVFNNSVPPTRPSSRVSNARPVHGPSQNPDLPRQETYEEQLQRAKAISLTDSQTLPAQEMGVAYPNPYFGPPSQTHYESEKWAMTLPEAHTQEIVLNPEPFDRKRKAGTPAFFRPSSSGHGLPAFIKILHEIPMAREALLNGSYTLGDYGRETDWWDGTPVKVLRVVNADEDGEDTGLDDVIYEIQRLMAFLEKTERAYGSTDALTGLHQMSAYPSDIYATYLKLWRDATQSSAKNVSLSNMFVSRGVRRQSVEPREQEFFCLSIKVDSEVGGRGMTLYDAIDDVLWAGAEDAEVFLDKVGDVLTLEIDNQCANVSGLGIGIPAIWYADRYLESSIQASDKMRARKAAVDAQVQEVNRVQALMTQYRKPDDGRTLGADDLVNKVTTYFQQSAAFKDAETAKANVTDDEVRHNSLNRIMEELITLTKRVSAKLDAFQHIRDSTLDRIKDISKLYTEPSNDPEKPPNHKYTLRGVIGNPQTVYVLEKDIPEQEDDILSTNAKDWQWWRLEYTTNSTNPITTTKVTEAQVLDAASNDSRKAVLVYASERAVYYKTSPLPPPLHNFIRADNLAFAAELDAFKSTAATADPSPTSLQKRKASSSSDLEVEFSRSPPADRSRSPPSSTSSLLDPDQADFDNDILCPERARLPTKTRPLAPKTGIFPSSDNKIPVSLPVKKAGQEMQESGRGGMLTGMERKYKLGSYVPEINMEDEDEDEGYIQDSEEEKRPKG